jgi:hypothetical protein
MQSPLSIKCQSIVWVYQASFVIFCFFGLLTCNIPVDNSKFSYVPDCEIVIKRMKDYWEGKWPRYVSFDQEVHFYSADSIIRQEVWKEILANPGHLHIRIDGFESGNGALFLRDSLFLFRKGELVREEAYIHELLLLLGDIYFIELEETLNKLEKLGVDLSLRTEAIYQDRPVWVFGTNDPRITSRPQFWIDQEHYWVVRTVTNKDAINTRVDIQEYQIAEGYPIASELHFFQNDQLLFSESYFNIKFPSTIDSLIFSPSKFSTARW